MKACFFISYLYYSNALSIDSVCFIFLLLLGFLPSQLFPRISDLLPIFSSSLSLPLSFLNPRLSNRNHGLKFNIFIQTHFECLIVKITKFNIGLCEQDVLVTSCCHQHSNAVLLRSARWWIVDKFDHAFNLDVHSDFTDF